MGDRMGNQCASHLQKDEFEDSFLQNGTSLILSIDNLRILTDKMNGMINERSIYPLINASLNLLYVHSCTVYNMTTGSLALPKSIL